MQKLTNLFLCFLFSLSNNITHAFSLKQSVKKIYATIKEHPYATAAIAAGIMATICAYRSYQLSLQEKNFARSCIKNYDLLINMLNRKAAELSYGYKYNFWGPYTEVYSIDFPKFYAHFCSSPECTKKLIDLGRTQINYNRAVLFFTITIMGITIAALNKEAQLQEQQEAAKHKEKVKKLHLACCE